VCSPSRLGQNGVALSTVFRVDHLFLDFVALDPPRVGPVRSQAARPSRRQWGSHKAALPHARSGDPLWWPAIRCEPTPVRLPPFARSSGAGLRWLRRHHRRVQATRDRPADAYHGNGLHGCCCPARPLAQRSDRAEREREDNADRTSTDARYLLFEPGRQQSTTSSAEQRVCEFDMGAQRQPAGRIPHLQVHDRSWDLTLPNARM
jgi:hypothetical protein